MGAGTSSCCQGIAAWRSRKAKRERYFTSFEGVSDMDTKADARADEQRACILDLVEEKEVNGALWRKRSMTLGEPSKLAEIMNFREEFYDCIEFDEEDQVGRVSRMASIVPANDSPWGRANTRGGDVNSWDEADGTSFQVRGPTFDKDRKKVPSQSALAPLVLVDLLESEVDIPQISACKATGMLRRIRDSGERRRLFILNFRVVPLHLVIVFALPSPGQDDGDSALALLNEFVGSRMEDDERNQRLKVIPRVLKGPWVAKGLLGETPGILGKKIPVQYFAGRDEFEVSIQCTASSVAQRIVRVLKPAASALTLELAFVIQGNDCEELPERILGSFRLISPDVSTLRAVSP